MGCWEAGEGGNEGLGVSFGSSLIAKRPLGGQGGIGELSDQRFSCPERPENIVYRAHPAPVPAQGQD
ncbi:hypothetical protein E2C01_060850 [Portunus trituberculatus]|uniref:Uncharacterized protein n=1 Tax=Portunus trituberculatus TaxID=210409 RepID=A0A5B7HCS9_PORTR|nr:hypothetical protein [Portunus trituberculatus]